MKKAQFIKDLKSGKFAAMVSENIKGETVGASKDVANIIRPLVARHPDQEAAYFMFVNGMNNVITIEKMFVGTLTSSAIYPRELLKKVFDHQAAAVVMIHNHPSGSVQPSIQDRRMTKNLLFALYFVDVAFLDHLVISPTEYFSFADQGIIRKMQKEAELLLTAEQILTEEGS